MGIPPLLGRHAEQRHVQDISLVGIDQGNLTGGQFRRNQIFLDGICVNTVIDLGKVALDVPAKLFHLLSLEAFKLFD